MSTTTPTPTAEQEARAKWDLLLADLEMRAEQVRQMKAPESLSLRLADLELKQEQIRQLKTYEPRRLMIQGLTAGAAILGAGAALGAFLAHVPH